MIKIQKRIKDLQTEYNELSSYIEDCLKSKFERITKVGTSQTLNCHRCDYRLSKLQSI
jgi:hypothetical protein